MSTTLSIFSRSQGTLFTDRHSEAAYFASFGGDTSRIFDQVPGDDRVKAPPNRRLPPGPAD